MFQLTALYNPPADSAAFDKHYDDVHAGLAAKLPGLQRYTVARPGPDPEGNPPAYHLVAVLEWADAAADAGGAPLMPDAGGSPVASGFICSQVIGLMVTGEWYGAGFESVVDNTRWQIKNAHHAYTNEWANPQSSFWSTPISSAPRCRDRAGPAPDG